MRDAAIAYTAVELRWIKQHCTLPRRAAHVAFCETFSRHDVTFENYKALCTRKGWSTGRTGCFQPGIIPWNTGRTMPPNPNSARTQFKKGQNPYNTKYAGHERLSKDGYVEISIEEPNPHTGFERRYVLKHKYLWEKTNGPVPQGMCLKCLDGNRQNTDPSNWECIPRGVSALLNGRWSVGYDEAPAEIKPTIMALAKLKYQVKRVSPNRRKKDSHSSTQLTSA